MSVGKAFSSPLDERQLLDTLHDTLIRGRKPIDLPVMSPIPKLTDYYPESKGRGMQEAPCSVISICKS